MKQRVLPILLSLALCLTLLPAAAWATDGPEPGGEQQNDPVTAQTKGDQGESGSSSAGGSTDTGSGGEDGGGTDALPPVGDGSEEKPYQIGTAEELLWFAGLVNGTPDGEAPDTDAYAVLTADIDLSSVCGEESGSSWTPIGPDKDNAYTGAFDGGGYTIEGLYINSEATYAGLFGVVGEGGTVQNLTVAGSVTGSDGSTATYTCTGGVAGQNSGTVADCSFTGAVTGGQYSYIGGVAGENTGTVTNCRNSGDVTGSNGYSSDTGGVVGCNVAYEGNATITNCCNTGDVTGSGSSFIYTGGVVGYNGVYGDSAAIITNCRNSGDVTGTVTNDSYSSGTGGVAGENGNDSTIKNCYSTGDVTGSGNKNYTGGVAGNNYDAVTNCYNTGAVTGNSTYTGGVVGKTNNGTITNCYYLTDDSTSTDAAALTAEEFKVQSSFTDWDFETVWTISSVLGRPVLVDNREADGTAGAPYQIGTAEQLAAFRDKVNGSNGTAQNDAHAVLTADIDLEGSADDLWTPIGSDYRNVYTGTFDGDGHTISGLYVSRDNYVGLFGSVGAGGAVKNLKVSGTVTGSGITAGASRPIGGVVAVNAGTVENCVFTGTVTGPSYSISIYTGGVVGRNTGAIKNCSNTGTITGHYNNFTGGVAGFNNGGTIENCYNTGTVNGNGYHTGGVAGYNQSGTIENCYNTGKITGSSTYTGSVMGSNFSGTVKNCYYLADEGLTGIDGTEDITGTAEGKTEAEFASGAVARLLGNAYGQTLGEDDFPQLIALDPDVPRVYQVTFALGYDGAPEATVSYTNGAVTPPADPTRTGYTFTGWEGYTDAMQVAADTVFTAQWAAAPTGGGSGTPTYRPDVEQSEGGEVSVSPSRPERGDDVTVTPDPDEGFEVDTVTVTDRNGNEVEVTDNGDGTFSFTQPSGKVTIEVTFREVEPDPLPFTDVPAGVWYEDAVRYVYENGLMAGTGADTFGPEAVTTRGQIVTILWRLAGSPQVNYLMDFDDVDPAAWYAEAIRWAASEGIATGYGNGTFGPNDPITREQLAVMLYRYAQHEGYDTTQGGMAIREYADYDQISDFAREALDWAVSAGIINGTSATTLSPSGSATRAQVAVILMRFCELDK